MSQWTRLDHPFLEAKQIHEWWRQERSFIFNLAHWEEEVSKDPRPIVTALTAFLGLYRKRIKAKIGAFHTSSPDHLCLAVVWFPASEACSTLLVPRRSLTVALELVLVLCCVTLLHQASCSGTQSNFRKEQLVRKARWNWVALCTIPGVSHRML